METQTKTSNQKKSQISNASRVILGIAAGVVLAAVILLVQLLLNTNALQPGAYEINEDNYDRFIVLSRSQSNYYVEIEQGKDEQTSMVGTLENDRAPMFYIVHKFIKSGLSGTSDKELTYIENNNSRYQISDLRVRFRFTYSLNGVESSEDVEVKIGRIEGLSDSCIYLPVPDEAIVEATSLGSANGYYLASFDRWSVEITDISGYAEVKEGSGE